MRLWYRETGLRATGSYYALGKDSCEAAMGVNNRQVRVHG
jgi:hypothetical protein